VASFGTYVSLDSLNLRGCVDSIVEFLIPLGNLPSLSDVSDCDMLWSACLIGICKLAEMGGREIPSCVLGTFLLVHL
jgi:hypothetical protein